MKPTLAEPTGSVALVSQSILLSLPAEIRDAIFTACIEPSRWTDCDWDELPDPPPSWYLSHTIPPALVQVSKQVRHEALDAIAAYSDLAVVCNVIPSGTVQPGYILDGLYRGKSPPAKPTRDSFGHMSKRGHFGRVRKQCAELVAPRGLKLTFKLIADGEGSTHQLVDELEAVRRSVAIAVFLANEYLDQWQHVHLDLEDVDEAMRIQHNSGWFCVPDDELDEYLDRGWIAIIQEFYALRNKARKFTVDLKGWRQDRILGSLSKG